MMLPSGTTVSLPHSCGHRVEYRTHQWTEAYIVDKLIEACPVCQWAGSRSSLTRC